MTTNQENRNPHFVLEGVTLTEPFSARGMGPRSEIPIRGRQEHSRRLLGQLSDLESVAETAATIQRQAGMEEGLGLRVEFESFPGIELAFESLARENTGIELFNVRDGANDDKPGVIQATVFVPDGKLSHFENLIRDYVDEKVDVSRDCPDQTDSSNHVTQWDGSNYKRAA